MISWCIKFDSSYVTDNHDDIPRQDISKIDRDIYMDYAFLDTIEDNVSSVSESKGTINGVYKQFHKILILLI